MKKWKHVGGGCSIGGKEKYPCDDCYENTETGKTQTVFSTKEAHFKMPKEVNSIAELHKRKGVKK